MKKQFLGYFLGVVLLFPTFGTVFAEDQKSDLDAKMAAAKAQASGIQSDLEKALADVNQVYQKAYESKQAVIDGQKKLDDLSKQMASNDQELAAREIVMAQQMRQLQTEPVSANFITTILTAGNLSDLITRVVSLNTYRQMQNEKVANLEQLKAKAVMLKDELKIQQIERQKAAESYEIEYAQLEQKLSHLRGQIADNQAQLTALSQSKAALEKREADAAAREKAKENTPPTSSQSSKTPQPIITPESETPNKGQETPTTQASPSGQTMTVSASGYSSDGEDSMTPGHITATGIDLWVNPMCIAVDPSVIPLGSMVEVPGYGIAIAGDTGGAIKGYKIDLHFKTSQAARNWGRRTVTIKVLG